MTMPCASRLLAACAAALLLPFGFPASAAPPVPDPAARAQLAPGGKLRVALLVTNPNFVTAGTMGPEAPRGIAVDLGKEIATLAGATFEPVRYDAIAKLVADARAGAWDVAFLGYEPSRAADMDFSDPYMNSENTYLVPPGSGLMTVTDVDRDGVRIGVSTRSAQEAFLKAELKKARLVPTANAAATLEELAAKRVDAMAAGRTSLELLAAKMPGYRVVQGNYRASPLAMAVPKGRPAAAAYAKVFISHAKESGLVKASIDRANLVGVSIPR